jgi:hypothetical protein
MSILPRQRARSVGCSFATPRSSSMSLVIFFSSCLTLCFSFRIYSSYVNGFDSSLARIQSWSADSRPSTSNGIASPALGSAGHPSMLFDPSASIVSTLSTSQRKRIKSFLKVRWSATSVAVDPSLTFRRVQRCRAHPEHSQISLESYLLLPVQRVPRYRMLLESLLTCTPRAPASSLLSPDASAPLEPHPVIQEALDLIADVATSMNERKRETEGRAQLLYWQTRIGNKFRSPLVQPHRSLLRSGNLVRFEERGAPLARGG